MGCGLALEGEYQFQSVPGVQPHSPAQTRPVLTTRSGEG